MKAFRLLLIASVAFLFTSCISNKKAVFFQDGGFRVDQPMTITNQAPEYRLQPNDVLSVKVKSLDTEDTEHLSLQADNILNVNEVSTFLSGYSVSDSGFIFMPTVGKIKVSGLTVEEARRRIQNMVQQSAIRRASVFVFLVSFKVSVSGEVQSPSSFYVYNNQMNLMEAISRSGGFLEFADLSRVHLIRQTRSGSEIVLLNLRKAEVLKSPYYYLLPNDHIYIPPLEEKHKRSNMNNLIIINSIIGSISATIAVLTFIETRRQNNLPE